MNKNQVLKFIGKNRAAKIEVIDVYVVTHCYGRDIWCIDALSLDEWTDDEGSHTFVHEGYDETNREMMTIFRNWIDELESKAA